MDNVNEALLNRKKLDGTPEDEAAAAKGLRSETAEARTGGEDGAKAGVGGTIRQMIKQAQNSANPAAGMPGAGEAFGSNPAAKATSQFLKQSWLNLIDSFGATLIYINIHVFGKSVFGEKMFCQLGEEWLPPEMQANKESVAVQAMIKKIGLLEKIVLIFLNLVVLFAVLAVLGILVTVASFFVDGSIVDKAKKLFQVITTLGFDSVMAMFNLFK